MVSGRFTRVTFAVHFVSNLMLLRILSPEAGDFGLEDAEQYGPG